MSPRITIIGAGPAGSVAAIVLARAGVDVTLVEQHRFPRDKVCGECISALGIDVLGRLRLSAAALDLHPSILAQTLLHTREGHSVQIPLPHPMWGISRRVFDTFLLDHARAAGANILQPARCESIEGWHRRRVRVRMLESDELHEIDAQWVIIADGRGSLMGRAPVATEDLGLKAHFTQLQGADHVIELFGVAGHYGGAAPIEDGLWNVAFSVPKSRVRTFGSDLDGLFHAILARNPPLRERLGDGMRVGDWLISPLPRFAVADHWPARVIPVGNAAAAVEPIGGEGIGLAMRSAEMAAEAIIDAIQNNTDVDIPRLRSAFRKLWMVRRLTARAGARLMSSPPLARLSVGLAHTAAAALALRLVGK